MVALSFSAGKHRAATAAVQHELATLSPLDPSRPRPRLPLAAHERRRKVQNPVAEHESTRVVARILGPSAIVVGVAVIARRLDMIDIVDAFAQSPATAFFTGVVSVFAGFALLAFHHRLSTIGAFVITAISALMVVRGGVLLFAPRAVDEMAAWLNETPNAWLTAGAALALAGAWISTLGFSARTPNIAS